MDKNKTGKPAYRTGRYLRYAVGEIVLVVIGILIALQINNWNENRKDNFVELKILQSFSNDLYTDIQNMNKMLKNDSLAINSNERLINILKEETSIYDSSMEPLFGHINRYDVFFPQKMGYESLKSKGLEILKNDNLKSDIVNLYDFQYSLLTEVMDLKKQLYLSTNPIFNEHLETISSNSNVEFDDSQLKKPNDFNSLKANTTFMNHLTHIYTEHQILSNYSKAILDIMVETKSKIEKEITKG